MTARIADERGFTLIELLVAATLSLIVFGATLTVFTSAQRTQAHTIEHTERQQEARLAIDRLMRDLRNLASPSDFGQPKGNAPLGVERNQRYDLIYKTVDGDIGASTVNPAAVKRVRYCLDASQPGNGRLLMQEQPADVYTTLPPADTACPGPSWPGAPRVVTEHLTNAIGGRDRPVFSYSADQQLLPYDAPEAMTNTTRVEVRLWLDGKPGDNPVERPLSSSVLLRNQNRPPTPRFQIRQTGSNLTLDGSSSDDPEMEPLTHRWYSGTEPLEGDPAPNLLGAGIIHQIENLPVGRHTFMLTVEDSAGTVIFSQPQTVVIG